MREFWVRSRMMGAVRKGSKRRPSAGWGNSGVYTVKGSILNSLIQKKNEIKALTFPENFISLRVFKIN